MVKHTKTVRRQIADKLLSVFDYFVGLTLKGLILKSGYLTRPIVQTK